MLQNNIEISLHSNEIGGWNSDLVPAFDSLHNAITQDERNECIMRGMKTNRKLYVKIIANAGTISIIICSSCPSPNTYKRLSA